jgi:NAD(P)-dependent dehydrogenase (short-subunit alcohol dehydrogenase family)
MKAKTGRDILFAHASFAELAPVGEITEEQSDRMFDTDVKGLLLTVRKLCAWSTTASRSS